MDGIFSLGQLFFFFSGALFHRRQIKARLKPLYEKMPDGTFKDIVKAAYFDRISLVATGFYRMEGITFDPATRKGGEGHGDAGWSVGRAALCWHVESDCVHRV